MSMIDLHVRSGDDIRDVLPTAGFAGDFLSYVDPVSDGPVPAGDIDLIEVRARYLAYDQPLDEVRKRLQDEQTALATFTGYERVTLWFEHDWLCQAILVRLLATAPEHPDLRIMSTDRFPGVTPFYGFGQLTSAQLATMAGHDEPVTGAAIALGTRAWAALRAPTPEPLQALVDEADPALPYLACAVRRHLQELPWRADGLALSERLCLRAVAAGPGTLREIFPRVQAADPAPFQGDTQVRRTLERLAAGERPALAVDGGLWTMTGYAERIDAGDAAWDGGPRWLGGLLLESPTWMWDDVSGRAVAA